MTEDKTNPNWTDTRPRNSRAIKYRKGYKYQLAEDFNIHTSITGYNVRCEFIRLTADGVLTIKKGYASDGPSGPTIDTLNFMRGSFVHDALYQLIRAGLIPGGCKDIADSMLYVLCLEDGMNAVRAYFVYRAVRWKGADALYPSSDNQIIVAP